MSLYDGLDIDIKDKSNKDVEWSSGIKLLQSQLQLKKTALVQAKKDQLRKYTTLTPVLDLKSRRDDHDEMPPPPVIGFAQNDSSGGATLLGGDWDIKDEYDPFWPNDYEKILRERREKEKKPKTEEKKMKIERRELQPRIIDDYDDEEPTATKPIAGVAIAPPTSLLENTDRNESNPPNFQTSLSSSIAAKIMAKYGFKEGQGLGKHGQGMSQALQVEKTSKKEWKIIHEKDIAAQAGSPSSSSQQTAQDKITEMMKNPSKVVLLKNMVGPGEVDEYLETETKEECGKYGEVISCLIFEIPSNIPEEEAVRIFIEFKRVESAIKALIDLNGRYFGGRVVKASFYDQDKFNRFELNE